MRRGLSLFFFISFLLSTEAQTYPPEWWAFVDPSTAPAWEILPQQAADGEVVLSKRTELGIFSNFAATPFIFEERSYASVEGFWQMMKFPDSLLVDDPRASSQFTWSYSREEVAALTAFEAKEAGKEGSKVMTSLDINWVSYLGEKMLYRILEKAAHYELIRKGMRAKLDQTEGLKDLLLKTGTLKLIPDHDQGANPPPAWQYFQIWMEFREELKIEQDAILR